ncbi:alpha/beta fold hydrolase [Streptosporangium sp. NPDC004631]
MSGTAVREVTVDGPVGTLAAVDYGGEGPDVLLVHGGNRTLLDWEPIRSHLGGMRLAAFDLRGHGRSASPPDRDFRLAGHEADVEAVVDALGLRGPVVVGHSIGANIAVFHADRHRDCPGIVVIDGYGAGVPDAASGLKAEDVARMRARLYAGVFAQLPPEALTAAEAEAVIEGARAYVTSLGLDPDLGTATARRALAPGPDGTLLRRPSPLDQPALTEALEELDFFGTLSRVACPVLMVKSDRPTPTGHLDADGRRLVEALGRGVDEELRRVEAACPNVEVHRLDGSHMLHLELAAAVGGLIEKFVGSLAR